MFRLKRAFLGVGSAVTALCLFVGCTATTYVATEDSALPVDGCSHVESVQDCGGMAQLIAQGREEKTLVLAGDPHSTSILGTVAHRFSVEYGIKVEWTMSGMTTEQRFEHAGYRSDAGQPDAFVLDPGDEVSDQDPVTPYRVDGFSQRIPDKLKDPSGRWVYDFGGAMAVGYNGIEFGESLGWKVLYRRSKKVSIVLSGKPEESASAAHALIMLDGLKGATLGSGDGLGLLKRQYLARGYKSVAKLIKGGQTVLLDWSYEQTAIEARLARENISWNWVIPDTAEVTGWHGVAINSRAQHPAAARLWEEYLFGTVSQIYFLKMGAMPSTYRYLSGLGEISQDLRNDVPVLSATPQVPSSSMIADVRAAAGRVWRKLHAGG